MKMVLYRGPAAGHVAGDLPPDTWPPENVIVAGWLPYQGFRQVRYLYGGEVRQGGYVPVPHLAYVYLGFLSTNADDDVYDELTHGPIPWEVP